MEQFVKIRDKLTPNIQAKKFTDLTQEPTELGELNDKQKGLLNSTFLGIMPLEESIDESCEEAMSKLHYTLWPNTHLSKTIEDSLHQSEKNKNDSEEFITMIKEAQIPTDCFMKTQAYWLYVETMEEVGLLDNRECEEALDAFKEKIWPS